MRAGLLGAVLSALCACGPPSGPPPPVGSVGVQLGTIDVRRHGDARWVDITEGQDAELAPGAQGGFHIWLRYRLSGAAGRVVQVKRLADRIGPQGQRDRVLTTDGLQLVPEGAAAWEVADPIANFMCPTPIGINVIDETIELLVQVSEPDGAVLGEGRARVVARCPPAAAGQDVHDFCRKICSG